MGRRYIRKHVPRLEVGTGMVLVQTPIVALIEQSGMTVPQFIRLVRSGAFNSMGSEDKFNCSPSALAALRRTDPDVPADAPDMEGHITWRRKTQGWSIDVNPADLGGKGMYWSSGQGGVPQLRVDGVNLPESVQALIGPGTPLADIVGHPAFTDRDILIQSFVCWPPTPDTSTGAMTGGSTEFKLSVPCVEFEDQKDPL